MITCKDCQQEYEPTRANFYFQNGKVLTKVCKPCYKTRSAYLQECRLKGKQAQHRKQHGIKYGQLCQCKKCGKQLAKTAENFYFRTSGTIQTYECKPCYYQSLMEAKKNKVQIKREKVQDNLTQAREKVIEKANTRTFPKGHPMNPTKEQRQALIEQCKSKIKDLHYLHNDK